MAVAIRNVYTAVGTGASAAVTFTPLAGSYLDVFAYWTPTATTPTGVSDNHSGTYNTSRENLNDTTFNWRSVHYPGTSTTANTSTTVTVAISGSVTWGIAVVEVTGSSGWQASGGQFSTFSSAANNATSGSITVTAQPCLMIGMCADTNGDAVSAVAGTGFTDGGYILTGMNANANFGRYEYQRFTGLTLPTGEAATFTLGGSSHRSVIGSVWTESGTGLAATTGTFAYTGQAVSFAVSALPPVLLAQAGNYSYVLAPGSSDFQIVATNGAYVLSGQAIALVAVQSPVSLSLQTGFYSIAAQTALLAVFIPPPGSFPSVIGQYYWVATLMLQQAGALNPSLIGYFGSDPITIKWQSSPLPPGTVIAQSVSPGTINFKTNSPITLTVSEYPMGSAYPGGGTLTGGVA